jgi:hypothetical protein
VAAVQFWGLDSVLKAYDQRSVETWALFQTAKNMLQKGNDRETLAEFIKTLWQESTAVYTLQFYECSVEDVKPSTPNDGSFNFRLSEPEGSTRVGSGGNNSLILSELNALKLKFEQWESEDIETDPEPDMFERINGLLEKPAIVGLINKLTGLNMQPIGKVGNVPGESVDQINKAIEILKTKDPFLGVHLMKLATMATNRPEDFKFLLSTLDSMT